MAQRLAETSFDAWYYNRVLDGDAYHAASTGAVTVSTVSTTITGLVLHNPPTSTVDLVVRDFTFAPSSAPGASIVGLNISAVLETTTLSSVTAMVIHNAYSQGSGIEFTPTGGRDSQGLVSSAATAATAPVWFRPIAAEAVAASSIHSTTIVAELYGSLILPPGAFCALGYLANAAVGIAGVSWAEVEHQAP